ncbi:MAG: cytochrome-c peroxidase [Planctomycetota bacterium]|nr:cytochrome-c peroxidase [Planctomycetota bacterium]
MMCRSAVDAESVDAQSPRTQRCGATTAAIPLCATLAIIGLVGAANLPAADPPAKHLLGLPAIAAPKDNPQTPEKIALGKQLYFDRRLSVDNTVSCADCHDPKKGFSNGEQFATGVKGQKGGRAGTLEEQALGPIANPIEMALPLPEMEKKLNGIAGYRQQFKKVFGVDKISSAEVAKAIASYERTAVSGGSPYDHFKQGEVEAMSESARSGMKLFFGKANCSSCHAGPNFTDNAFHNIGVGMDQPNPDVGREAISKLEGDRGAFKTPTVRDIAHSGPYMHDGSMKTLAEVVEHYNKGGTPNPWLDEELFPLKLTAEEKADLVKFMEEGLSSPHSKDHEAPKLPE